MLWNVEKNIAKLKDREDYVDSAELARLQAELNELKEQNGEPLKRGILLQRIDNLMEKGKSHCVNRNNYVKMAACCGWFTGSHRFYAGQKVTGFLYLLFFWTGIPFAMTVLDLMAILPKQADQYGNVVL